MKVNECYKVQCFFKSLSYCICCVEDLKSTSTYESLKKFIDNRVGLCGEVGLCVTTFSKRYAIDLRSVAEITTAATFCNSHVVRFTIVLFIHLVFALLNRHFL